MAQQLCPAVVGRLAVALAIFTVLSSASLVQDQQPVIQEAAQNMASLPTLPPQEAQSATSVLHTLKEAFLTQLENAKHQWINGLVALVFGLVLMIEGELTFKWLVLVGAFFAAMLFAQNEVAAFFARNEAPEATETASYSILKLFVGLEAGACVTYVAFQGYKGVLLMLSAGLGSFIASSGKWRLELWGFAFIQKPWVLFAWYSFCVLVPMALVATKKYVKVLVFLTPALGGALVASALTYFFTTAAAVKGWWDVSQPAGAWVDFMRLLCVPGAKDVGIFTSYAPLGKTWTVDRLVGCLLWAILFCLGYAVQSRRKKEATNEVQARESRKADVNEPLLAGF